MLSPSDFRRCKAPQQASTKQLRRRRTAKTNRFVRIKRKIPNGSRPSGEKISRETRCYRVVELSDLSVEVDVDVDARPNGVDGLESRQVTILRGNLHIYMSGRKGIPGNV